MAHRTEPALQAHRGTLLHFHADPGANDSPHSYEYLEDGLLLIENGLIARTGPAAELLAGLPTDTPVINHGDGLLLPGFIDTHMHYPQTDVIASGGSHVLDWLEQYTFPAERRFADGEYAQQTAEFFLDELLRNGTTTALVFGTVHAQSVEAFFQVAARRDLRMLAGKVLMDRHCPEYLRDDALTGIAESRQLLEKWHGHARLSYAITPRFAPSSTPAQLQGAGELARQFPDAYVQTHLAENLLEVNWARQLFPEARSYLGIYQQYGLLRERAIYAHCIHLDAEDRTRLAASGAAAAFCPTSNLYLGSGLFDIDASDAAALHFSPATDVGGGTSFSMLRTLGEAYKVAQLRGQKLSPLRAFYLATRGAARCLHLEQRIGSFATGNEADFIVLDAHATPLLERRCAQARSLSERLLILMTLGDDRVIAATYIMGQRQQPRLQ